MRTVPVALLLIAALPLLATHPLTSEISFNPAVPTDRSFVVLEVRDVWRDPCVPRNPVLTRAGNAITVRFTVPPDLACPAVLAPWEAKVPIGVLTPGVYAVTLEVDDFDGLRRAGVRTLVVRESAPAFVIEPQIASTAGGTVVAFRNVCPNAGTPVTVSVSGAGVPVLPGCPVKVTLPAHAPGPVDVTLTVGDLSSTVVNALQYVDPAAAPDPALYERVLVPVIFNGSGAFGSVWQTNVEMTNLSAFRIDWVPEVSRPLGSLDPERSTSLSAFGERPAGLVLFLPRGADVRFGYLIRDLSRDASQWGTEIPVVRERDTQTVLVLPNVPFDDRYRLQLRIYDIDGVSGEVMVMAGTQPVGREVSVAGPCTARPCNSNQPAFASVDLRQLFPTASGAQTIRVFGGSDLPARFWAFVTVTNNETQHVTVISPQ
jgi:hypothetical protein